MIQITEEEREFCERFFKRMKEFYDAGIFHDSANNYEILDALIEKFKPLRVEHFGNARCITSDGRNVNIADELNRPNKEKNEPI